ALPPAAAGGLIDVDRLVPAGGLDDVRRPRVVRGVRGVPDLDPVRASRGQRCCPPCRIAGQHWLRMPVIRAELARRRSGLPVRTGAESGVGIADDDAPAATAAVVDEVQVMVPVPMRSGVGMRGTGNLVVADDRRTVLR